MVDSDEGRIFKSRRRFEDATWQHRIYDISSSPIGFLSMHP